MKIVNRTSTLPVYIFSRVDDIKKKLINNGIDIIDLGIGDPDLPTPEYILNSMIKAVKIPENHRYPPYNGSEEFRRAVSLHYKNTYNVDLNYESEIITLIGSKEGIAHLFLAAADSEDFVLIPDPSYPVYNAAAKIAGCNIYRMILSEANNYLPKLENIYPDVARRAKIIVVNYPNNPTGAVANKDFYKGLVDFGLINDIIVANDGAYMDICSPEVKPISIMQTPRAKETCVEFGTLSKSHNMAGWRIGYAVGNSEIIKRLMVIKTNFDSGQFSAVQYAGAEALNNGYDFIKHINDIYNDRKKYVVEELKNIGLKVYDSMGTFYVWFRVPNNYKSEEFASFILENTGVLITPGNAYGPSGEGYCRISLTVDNERLKKAIDRITKIEYK